MTEALRQAKDLVNSSSQEGPGPGLPGGLRRSSRIAKAAQRPGYEEPNYRDKRGRSAHTPGDDDEEEENSTDSDDEARWLEGESNDKPVQVCVVYLPMDQGTFITRYTHTRSTARAAHGTDPRMPWACS